MALPQAIEIGAPVTSLTMEIESTPETVKLCIEVMRSVGIAAMKLAAADLSATESEPEPGLTKLTAGNDP